MDPVGFGTWRVEPPQAKEVVLTALDAGYTHIDCAHLYGNEREIGEAFGEFFKTHDRSKYWVTTKLWNTNHHPDNVEKQLRGQLRDLQLEYVDLFIIHWPVSTQHGEDPMPHDSVGRALLERGYGLQDTWRAMEALVSKGLARHVGVSNFCVAILQDLLSYSRIRPYCNQIEVNITFQNRKLVEYCISHGIHVVAYRPLGGPELCNLSSDPKLAEIASRHGKTVAQVILRWHFQRYGGNHQLYHIIAKTQHRQRMLENLHAAVGDFTLDRAEMGVIEGMDKGREGRICTAKYGVPIFD